MDPLVDETGQPYAYSGDDPVNNTDPLGLCSTSGGTFLVSGACHWTSRSWVSQTENTLQGQKGGGFSITNGLKAVADYGAGFGNAVVSTVTLGHVHIAPPYCGFGWASDVGMGYGYVALAVLGGGAGGAEEVSDGAATVEEVEAEGQAADQGGVQLQLRYKEGWNPTQIAAADNKVAALNSAAENGDLSVTAVERGGTSASSMFRSAGGEIPNGSDVDHVLDLQLGGANDISNLSPLDASVNRSLGAQVACQIRGLAAGSPVVGVSIC